jgi:hypothetical protein
VDTKLKCQRSYAKNSGKFLGTLLKSVQKCRNALANCKEIQEGAVKLIKCKLSGLSPQSCKVNDAKTAKAVNNARTKALDAIKKDCSDQDAIDLKLCDPDQSTADAAATVHDPDPRGAHRQHRPRRAERSHRLRVRAKRRLRRRSQESDQRGVRRRVRQRVPGALRRRGRALPVPLPRREAYARDRARQRRPRQRVDGQSHDSGIVEGGGYVADLWDCDGPGGPDTICAVGPSCALAPHNPCNVPRDSTGVSADSLCTGGPGDFCRMTAGGSTGPHCSNDPKKRCTTVTKTTGFSVDCGGADCIYTAHERPLPLSSAAYPFAS